MNPNELMNKLNNAINQLDELNEELKELSRIKAETEKKYKIARSRIITKLRTTGTPVGIIKEIADGDVAELEFEKQIAENNYYITLSAIDNLRAEIEVYRTLLSWLRAEYLNS